MRTCKNLQSTKNTTGKNYEKEEKTSACRLTERKS